MYALTLVTVQLFLCHFHLQPTLWSQQLLKLPPPPFPGRDQLLVGDRGPTHIIVVGLPFLLVQNPQI